MCFCLKLWCLSVKLHHFIGGDSMYLLLDTKKLTLLIVLLQILLVVVVHTWNPSICMLKARKLRVKISLRYVVRTCLKKIIMDLSHNQFVIVGSIPSSRCKNSKAK